MALTSDDAVTLGVHVLNTLQHPAKTGQIAAFALQPQFRAHCAQHALDLSGYDSEIELAAHIGRSFSRHCASTPQSRQAVQKAAGVWSLGPGASAHLQSTNVELQRPSDNQFTGLAGEYAVMSELLACSWNVAKFPHDDGVDIVATKDGSMRTVQVKTAHGTGRGHQTFSFSVSSRAHEQYSGVQHYYVLVLRRIVGPRWLNDCIILNVHDLNDLLVHGNVDRGDRDSFRIGVRLEGARFLIGERDVSAKVNRFQTLFV